MSIINGKVIATSDVNLAIREANNGAKIVFLGDIESAPKIDGMFTPTLLVPSYQTLSLLIDGRLKDYEASYIRSLYSPKAVESFASIIGLLYFGNLVVMLFPSENTDLGYSNLLLTHMQKVYGITVQSKTTYFNYDQRFDPMNARILYMYNIIGPVDYVMMTKSFNDVDIDKIKNDLGYSWNLPMNVPNEKFVEVLARKKEEVIKYGKVREPIMRKVQ